MNEITFHFFDVGHGDSILVEIHGDATHYIVIDTHKILQSGRSNKQPLVVHRISIWWAIPERPENRTEKKDPLPGKS